MSAYLESDSMAPLRLVTDDDAMALEMTRRAHSAPTNEQLLFSAVITLLREVKRLKKNVSDLEGRERI